MRSVFSGLLSITLAVTPVLQAHAQRVTRADIEACKSQDEAEFQRAVADVTIYSLETSIASIDYKALVADEWRKGDVGAIIDTRVDIAIKEIRAETSWGALLKTLAYREEAQKLATDVAERVYRSDAVSKAIESLASNVGEAVGKRIEFAAKDASGPALQCLQAYLGPRYGTTVSSLVRDDAQKDFAVSADEGTAQVSPGTVLRQAGGGATGVAILIVRRQLANLARTVGQRIVGSILARLVSVVAGGVGLVLIAKDIWDFSKGVLPIIETEMKSEETKEKVREVLAETIAGQISAHVTQIGNASAERVVEVWRQFRRAHLKALELAERNQTFRNFLDTIAADRMGRLDEVVGLVLAEEGEQGIVNRLADGTLNEAVSRLPDSAIQIARATRSLETGLMWHGVAAADIDAVFEEGIYRETQPGTFTPHTLRRLIALDDRVAILRLAGLPAEARTSLLDLEPDALKGLARSLDKGELTELTGYLIGLGQAPREQVLRAVAKAPAKLKLLARARVRQAVLSSSDQSAAVEMMLRTDTGFSPSATWEDVQMVIDGRVSPILLVDRHPIALAAAAFALLLFIFMLRRLFTAPRRAASKNV
ncbi:MAG: hypothetical protein KJ622_04400 [Alphaproteobacteria bacterium]|nr:hypothetical protein [Alphaproteobacteria bacterium]